MSVTDSSLERTEARRVARTMQEIIENKKEIAQSLYQYMGPVMTAEKCILCSGDYMHYNSSENYMLSSRNAKIGMSPEALADLITAGKIGKVFDAGDINHGDFDQKINAVVDKIRAQGQYIDADRFYKHDHRDRGIAAFVSEQDPDTIEAAIVRDGAEINSINVRTMPKENKVKMFDHMRECSYMEFNPGMQDIQKMISRSLNPETQSKSNAYAKMRETYDLNGGNTKSLDDIRNDKSMSATQKLKAMGESLDDMQQEQAKQAKLDQQQEEQWTPASGRGMAKYMD